MKDNRLELKNKRIAVLMGGRSREREISLRSGSKVLASLKSQGFSALSFDTDPDLIENLRREKIDVVFIALHGKYGEDGVIQGLLEMNDYPYTGSKILASALAMHKVASKRIFDALQIPTPKYRVIKSIQDCDLVKKIFPFPVVVKPISEGSSLGVSIVKNPSDLEPVLEKTLAEFKDIFVEEYISGREVTVGILGVGGETWALPVLELAPKKEFYDYEAKYTQGLTEFILPARMPKPLYEHTQEIALSAHQALGCQGVSRVDILISKDGLPYVHEVNTIPGMTDLSDLPAQAQAAGISYDELVLTILQSALS